MIKKAIAIKNFRITEILGVNRLQGKMINHHVLAPTPITLVDILTLLNKINQHLLDPPADLPGQHGFFSHLCLIPQDIET